MSNWSLSSGQSSANAVRIEVIVLQNLLWSEVLSFFLFFCPLHSVEFLCWGSSELVFLDDDDVRKSSLEVKISTRLKNRRREESDGSFGFLCAGSVDLEQPLQSMTRRQMNLMVGLADNRHPQIRLVEVGNPAPQGVAEGKGDDGDEGSSEERDGGNSGKGRKGLSPWHRMKWTDDVVRLLITVVAYVGDDGVPDDPEGCLKRKHGVLQKKGKWKTVSKIMIGQGCRISPQQCEDKFNDLNKRYKKLNDVLGRGTSCRVVENPALLDSLPQLSAKAKDVTRKLLASKHLFYKEMRAYHDGERIPTCPDLDLHLEGGCRDGDDDGATSDEDEDISDDSEDYSDEDNNDGSGDNDRGRSEQRSFGFEIGGVRKQLLELEEESLDIEARTLELEKQRFKWMRYRSKKSRELERLRLKNERKVLENERSFLELRQKELEINTLAGSKPHGMNISCSRYQIDLSRQ